MRGSSSRSGRSASVRVYRRLAKALHPDLERDPEERERESAVMQEVTAAYARGDLHALLRLELEWLDGVQTGSSQLADETLDAYAQFLKQQAAALQNEIATLPLHPRYAELLEMEPLSGMPMAIDVPLEVARLDTRVTMLTDILRRLTTTDPLPHVRELIREHRQASQPPRRRGRARHT